MKRALAAAAILSGLAALPAHAMQIAPLSASAPYVTLSRWGLRHRLSSGTLRGLSSEWLRLWRGWRCCRRAGLWVWLSWRLSLPWRLSLWWRLPLWRSRRLSLPLSISSLTRTKARRIFPPTKSPLPSPSALRNRARPFCPSASPLRARRAASAPASGWRELFHRAGSPLAPASGVGTIGASSAPITAAKQLCFSVALVAE